MPELRARYSINADVPTFIGSSLEGLFGAWVLLTVPSTFGGYILANPTLFWNDEEGWHREQEGARTHDDSRQPFSSVGGTRDPGGHSAERIGYGRKKPALSGPGEGDDCRV